MPIEKHKDGKVVCIFGHGDILIAPGNDEGTTSEVGISLVPQMDV